ncbi:MAG TPA: hypothetical protein ENI76_06625, partial [Ignavibacteria bacterium]|nr:hypothetical protein [Ignavibacteria bacterium]
STVSIIKTNFILAPKSFIVISSDSSLLNVFTNPIELFIIPNMPSLNNSGDAVVIQDSLGLLIDSLSYLSSWGGGNGKSLERIDPNASSTLRNNWGTSTNSNGATPGKRNSLTPFDNDLSITSFTHSPQSQLIIEGNNINLSVTVKNIGKNTAASFSINLFNDSNFDNIGSANEIIFSENYSNLSKSDSITVATTINSPLTGNYNIIAEVIFTSDEDTSNNKSIDNFSVVNEPNSFNNIVINEIMYSPLSGQTEWVELYNRTDSPINVNGWSFADNNTTVTFTNTDVNIPAKSFIVLSKDSTVLTHYGIPVQLVVSNIMPSLNNSGDAVVIKDSLGLLIDSLSYLSTWGGSNGKSLERIDPNGSSTLQSNWGTSTSGNRATPGTKNSLTPFDNDLLITSFTHSPQLIIEGNNVNLSATIKNIGKNTATSFSINLFNDSNFDNIGSANEIIFSKNYSNLLKSDSITVATTINSPSAGNYNIIAEVIFTSDEDASNNKSIDNFTVLNEPNIYNNIVINEIMYAPTSNQNEWIELYNRSDSAIKIKKWSLSDKTSTVSITTTNFILAPKSFIVISSDSSLLNVFTNPIELFIIPNMPSLNNSGDAVVIKDSLGLLIDSLSYLSSWGGNNGKSLERIDPNVSSTLQSNWGTSTNSNVATPGERNSLTPFDNDLAVTSFTHSPQLIIEGNNANLSITVKNIGKNTAASFSINLFNDSNFDNSGTANELIFSQIYSNLGIGDSVIVNNTINSIQAGN